MMADKTGRVIRKAAVAPIRVVGAVVILAMMPVAMLLAFMFACWLKAWENSVDFWRGVRDWWEG